MTKLKKLKPIKKIAGEILIYLYDRQRSEAFALKNAMLRFDDALDTVALVGNGEIEKVLLYAANGSSSDAYNALDYLRENSLIEFSSSPDSGGVSILNMHVISIGVDIIEGIERNNGAVENFNIMFNFKLADNISIDALVKNEIESLVKASII